MMAAVAALATLGFVVANSIRQRKLLELCERIELEIEQPRVAAGNAPQMTVHNGSEGERLRRELAGLSGRISSEVRSELETVAARIKTIDERTEAMDRNLLQLTSRPAASPAVAAGKVDAAATLSALLPSPFAKGEALGEWLTLLASQAVKVAEAAAVLSALMELKVRLQGRPGSTAEAAAFIAELGERAYAWWDLLQPAAYPPVMNTDGSREVPTTTGEVNALWMAYLKPLCAVRWPDLQLHAFYPDGRLDSDLMVRVEGSGMQPTIQQPLSWAVTEGSRVLVRGKVRTH
jgi:hypothetical protein